MHLRSVKMIFEKNTVEAKLNCAILLRSGPDSID